MKNNQYLPYIIIVGLIILLFSMKSCNDKKYQQLKGKYEVLKENYQNQKDTVKIVEERRIKEKDSLNKEIIKREVENKNLLSINENLESKINSLKNKPISVPKDNDNLVKYFNDRYNTTENQVIDDKVGLGNETAQDVTYDLEEGDNLQEITKLQDEQIINQKKQISNLEQDKEDVKQQLLSAELSIEEQKKLQKLADDNINNLKSQVKTLNNKNTFNKILIPVAFGVGGFIGYQIAK